MCLALHSASVYNDESHEPLPLFKREAGTQNYNQYKTHIEIEICTKERGNIGEGRLKSAWGLGECFA